MSRSALNRQEGNVKERERRAEELFSIAVEEGRTRQRAKGVLPLWGPDDSFHLNPLLLRNIVDSPYFQKCCQNLNDWNAVVDDIYYNAQHMQPFQNVNSKTPSSAFCLLLRMLTLRMTEHQLQLTLDHADSPYIRAAGFLYLRYAGPPDQMFKWIEPFLYDQEEIQVTFRSHHGRFCPSAL
jgi:pre-mRNA-splicing factor 38B